MRACVEEPLLMMPGLLGCSEVGDFDEDRDGATYLESTSLLGKRMR